MPRPAKPWFRTSANAWYVKVNGKQVSLGVFGRTAKRQAVDAWHRLQANGKPKPDSKPEAKPSVTVQALADAFLADAEARVSPGCLAQYRKHLVAFAGRYGKRPAESITIGEAEAYPRRPEWSASYRNGFLSALVTAYRWAERSQVIARNPLQGVRKPPKASRGAKALVDADAYARLCAHADPLFGAFLRSLWLTGARPGEIAGLRAEDVDLAQGVAVLSEHKTAHLGKARILFLCPEALAVAKERLAVRPQGLLFPGQDGERMTAQAVGCRLRRLCVKAGVPHCIAYGALASGVPDATVAALMGHAGTAMLHKHYAHLTARSQALREAVASIRR
jgi:integrase